MVKRFLVYVAKVMVMFYIIMWGLDLLYTYGFYRARQLNKFYWVKNMKNEELDYVVLGSSRVKYHINADQINEKSGLVGYNLGESNQGLSEVYLMLKTFYYNNNKVDKAFLQIDDNWNFTKPDPLASSFIVPFIREKYLADYYQEYDSKYNYYRYVPFLRYMLHSHVIGARGLINVTLDDKRETSKFGFKALNGNVDTLTFTPKNFTPNSKNELINKIEQLLQQNGTELFYFTAPTLEYVQGSFDCFDTTFNNYFNFSDTNKYPAALFMDSIHLNKKGTKAFMKEFIPHYFTIKEESNQTYLMNN